MGEVKRKIERFEDLDAWQVARALTRLIYDVTRHPSFKRDFGLVDQIRRAVISIMNNIAEGFERGTNKDAAKFIFIARGSAGEVRSMLYVAHDQGYLTEEQFQACHAASVRCGQLCWGLIRHYQKTCGWRTGMAIYLFMLASCFRGPSFFAPSRF